MDINEQGQVVGSADTPEGRRHAYIWENGVMTDIGTSFLSQSEAEGINNLGQVVGLVSATGDLGIAFLWEDGEITELNNHTELGSLIPANAIAINDAGQIVGISVIPETASQTAFLWENGTMTDLGALGGNFPHSIAWDINEKAQVVGKSSTDPPSEHAFVWENSVMSDIGPPDFASVVYGINDLGVAVGQAQTSVEDKHFQAMLWKDGEIIDLSVLGNFFSNSSSAEDINNKGQIILAGNYRAILYDPTWGFLDLEELLLPNNGWNDLRANAINDKGQIVGWGYHNNLPRAYLMTPVSSIPAFSTWGLIAMTLFMLAAGTMVIGRHNMRRV